MTSAEFITKLRPLLAARAGLAGVAIHDAWTRDVASPAIVLVRARVRHDISWQAMGPQRWDMVTIPGLVVTTADTVQAAADAALDICAEIGLQLKTAPPSVGAQTLMASLETIGWLPYPSDKGGWTCDTEFDITYKSNIP